MTKRKSLVLIACATLLFCLSGAQAQNNSIGITPASLDAKVKRGASYTKIFTLTNNTGTRLRFKCSVSDMWYDEFNRRVSGRAGTLTRSASLWTQFFPNEIVIEPHSSGTVKAIITVPQTAAGSYYTVPIFEGLPADPVVVATSPIPKRSAIASIGIRFLGLMMFTTTDAAEYSVEIVSGQITAPSASAELAIQLDVNNRGTAHVRMRGAFAILNSSGGLVGRGAIPEKRYLPGQRIMLRAGWAGLLPAGKYTTVVTLSYDRVGLEPSTLIYELPLIVQ